MIDTATLPKESQSFPYEIAAQAFYTASTKSKFRFIVQIRGANPIEKIEQDLVQWWDRVYNSGCGACASFIRKISRYMVRGWEDRCVSLLEFYMRSSTDAERVYPPMLFRLAEQLSAAGNEALKEQFFVFTKRPGIGHPSSFQFSHFATAAGHLGSSESGLNRKHLESVGGSIASLLANNGKLLDRAGVILPMTTTHQQIVNLAKAIKQRANEHTLSTKDIVMRILTVYGANEVVHLARGRKSVALYLDSLKSGNTKLLREAMKPENRCQPKAAVTDSQIDSSNDLFKKYGLTEDSFSRRVISFDQLRTLQPNLIVIKSVSTPARTSGVFDSLRPAKEVKKVPEHHLRVSQNGLCAILAAREESIRGITLIPSDSSSCWVFPIIISEHASENESPYKSDVCSVVVTGPSGEPSQLFSVFRGLQKEYKRAISEIQVRALMVTESEGHPSTGCAHKEVVFFPETGVRLHDNFRGPMSPTQIKEHLYEARRAILQKSANTPLLRQDDEATALKMARKPFTVSISLGTDTEVLEKLVVQVLLDM